jgi:23S rRNA (cytosine1962-C5)-methyltransferase
MSRADDYRASLTASDETNAFRLIHGAEDHFPDCYLDLLGDYLLRQTPGDLSPRELQLAKAFALQYESVGIYHKVLDRHIRANASKDPSPTQIDGQASSPMFDIRENGVTYRLSFEEGYSTGIFLDQRENRRRNPSDLFGAEHQFPSNTKPKALNLFSYTCAFSVCAALGGATVTSVDLSKKYLDWGKQNFQANSLEPDDHDFIFGDVFDWLRRFRKKDRLFDIVLIDPPTFSKSKKFGIFRTKQDFEKLIEAATTVLTPNGTLFCSSNTATWSRTDFEKAIHVGIKNANRAPNHTQFISQPQDFPYGVHERPYLKTSWVNLS